MPSAAPQIEKPLPFELAMNLLGAGPPGTTRPSRDAGTWNPVPSLVTNQAPIVFEPNLRVGSPSSSASIGAPGHRPQPPFVGGPVTSWFVEPCTVTVADAWLLL